ncbi:hypothetical protein FVE85_8440 [Porphyridium purpureum]|uniref:Uncharacterized protein n=1 Tax=Porphyridium purpureum TaxID=35688 RepID=A0A5J4YKZ7_PORPP|nr:hypothetical protein FVE85_8440 [Porphyridium purpureum]|eukprot:POR5364..scf244_11
MEMRLGKAGANGPRNTRLCFLLAVVLIGCGFGSLVAAQCEPGYTLVNYTIAQWGDATVDTTNCNQVYLTRQWRKNELGMTVNGVMFPPTGWYDPSFDDASWGAGVLPFAGNIVCGNQLMTSVPGFPTIGVQNTYWPPNNDGNPNDGRNSYLAVRLNFYLSPSLFFRAETLYMSFIVDNDLTEVYVNGLMQVLNGALGRENCPAVSSIVSTALDSSVLVPEENTIALLAEDRGTQSYLNYQLMVGVCTLEPVASFPCTRMWQPPQPCMTPCASDPSACELTPSCALDGVMADENGNCLCELVDDEPCPSIDPAFVPGICYPKQARQSLRLISCDRTGEEVCRTGA